MRDPPLADGSGKVPATLTRAARAWDSEEPLLLESFSVWHHPPMELLLGTQDRSRCSVAGDGRTVASGFPDGKRRHLHGRILSRRRATDDTSRLSGNSLVPVWPRSLLSDEGALFLDQAALTEDYRAEPIKLLQAKRVHTRTVHAVELGLQPTPFSKAARDVAVHRGHSVVIRNALGAFTPSFDTLCRDGLLFALSAGGQPVSMTALS